MFFQTVYPLNEIHGIIEWLDNLMPLRVIITKFHKEKGIGLIPGVANQPELAKKFGAVPGDFNANKEKYFRLLEHYRPVFAEWFIRNFQDPQSWLMARLAYTRTTAVMSMVGYILGLGDRHCENGYDSHCGGVCNRSL